MLKLKKVISGGQTGADIAGLVAARRFELETGGTMPKGYRTSEGPRPKYKDLYGVVEASAVNYASRTRKNVRDSDATIRLAFNFKSPGSRRTAKAIREFRKPSLDVDLARPLPVAAVVTWLSGLEVEVLNVAGNSERTRPGTYAAAWAYLEAVFGAVWEAMFPNVPDDLPF